MNGAPILVFADSEKKSTCLICEQPVVRYSCTKHEGATGVRILVGAAPVRITQAGDGRVIWEFSETQKHVCPEQADKMQK
jgi:hypothetical protein